MEEKDLLDIINKLRNLGQEWKTVDSKQTLTLKEIGDKAEFVKDIVAMANNNEPSYLIIGLEDGTFKDIGKLENHYKKSDLNQLLSDKIDPPVTIDYFEFSIGGNEYAVIEIFGKNPPYLVTRDLVHAKTDRKRTRIYRGMIYVRQQDRTEGISRTELEELLKKRGIYKEFENESEYAQQLVRDKPGCWEYLLTAELLRNNLVKIRRDYNDLKRGSLFTRRIKMKPSEFIEWMQPKFSDLATLAEMIKIVLTEDIAASWGKPGEAGNPIEIKRAVEKLIFASNELVKWEIEVHSLILHDSFLRLKDLLEGWAIQVFDSIETLANDIAITFKQPNLSGMYKLTFNFPEPTNINEFHIEMKRLQNHPEEWKDAY